MADIHHTHEPERSGSGAALGVIIGVLLVLALLIGGWWLFFRTPAVVDDPDTTIIEQEAPDQPPPGDTDIDIEQDGGSGTTSPTP
jgi:hypothetical protein